MSKTVTLSKKKYEQVRKQAGVDQELVYKHTRAFEDIKHGRVTEWRPKK